MVHSIVVRVHDEAIENTSVTVTVHQYLVAEAGRVCEIVLAPVLFHELSRRRDSFVLRAPFDRD